MCLRGCARACGGRRSTLNADPQVSSILLFETGACINLELTKKAGVADDWGLPVSVSSVGRLQACDIAPGFSV